MRPFRTVLLAAMILALAAPVVAGTRAPKARGAAKAEKSLFAKPVEPMPPREEKPRGGWNGAYGGLNAGGGFSDQ